jgi:hypothetical protein
VLTTNHRKISGWSKEEKTSLNNGKMEPGKNFTLEILSAEGVWYIVIDGKTYSAWSSLPEYWINFVEVGFKSLDRK